jgi:DNA end-binding protein Ku
VRLPGQIAFGLVSIPVKLFSAAESSEKISFNMLHRDCGNRIQQQLFCPKDERTISRDEVVKGHEFSKGQYVLFNEDELKMLEEKSTQQIEITEFVKSELIDPIYFEKPYYLGPDKNGSRASVALRRDAGDRPVAGDRGVRRSRQGLLVVIRPRQGTGHAAALLSEGSARSTIEMGDAEVKGNELKMAVQLAEMSASDEFAGAIPRRSARRVRALIRRRSKAKRSRRRPRSRRRR